MGYGAVLSLCMQPEQFKWTVFKIQRIKVMAGGSGLDGHLVTYLIAALGNEDRFCNTIETVALINIPIEPISDCWQRKFSQPVNQNKRSRKICPKPI